MRDLVRTPLGVVGTVLGVKCVARPRAPAGERRDGGGAPALRRPSTRPPALTPARPSPPGRYANPASKDKGTVWLRYPTGTEHPFEPLMSRAYLGPHSPLGYDVCSTSDHVWRDVLELQQRSRKLAVEALGLAGASQRMSSARGALPVRPSTSAF